MSWRRFAGGGAGRYVTCAVPTLIATIAVWWALATNEWHRWGVEALPAPFPSPNLSGASASFGDLANITATAECMRDGTDYSVCDPYGRPFQPYVVLPARLLALFDAGPSATPTLGVLLAMTYIVTIGVLGIALAHMWRARTALLLVAQSVLGLLAISPPAMLAIERGQIEVLALAMTVIALMLLPNTRLGWAIVGAVSAGLAVVVKFFAIGLFAPFLRRGRPNWPALAALAACAVFLLLSWNDVRQAGSAARAGLPATSKSQFGAGNLIATLVTPGPVGYAPSPSISDSWGAARAIGIVVLLVAVIVASLALRQASLARLSAIPSASTLLVGSAGVLGVPFVLGSSHDYRMIFLLPVVVGALIWMSTGRALAGTVVVVGAAAAMVTGAAMVATPDGFVWGKTAMVVGDLGLLAVLATCGGVWVRGLARR